MTGVDEKLRKIVYDALDLSEELRQECADAVVAALLQDYINTNQRHYFMAKAIRAYLSALPAAPMPGVKATVRALVWEQENACIWSADDYKITDFQGVAGYPVPGKRFELRRSSGLSSKLPFNTLEAAKAAAQADYVQRILSALDVPAHPEGVKDAGETDEGWKEAAIAWTVCASIHREYAKGKDAFFKTRQSDFVKHEENARAKALKHQKA
jgi:hypothetical protein